MKSFESIFTGSINGTLYYENDECNPDDFVNATSTDCTDLQMSNACKFYKYGPTTDMQLMQVT